MTLRKGCWFARRQLGQRCDLEAGRVLETQRITPARSVEGVQKKNMFETWDQRLLGKGKRAGHTDFQAASWATLTLIQQHRRASRQSARERPTSAVCPNPLCPSSVHTSSSVLKLAYRIVSNLLGVGVVGF